MPRVSVACAAWLALALSAGAQAPTQQRLRPPFEAVFDTRWLQEAPWSSDPTALLETVEATAVSDRQSGAGLNAAAPPRIGIHAASWTELQYHFSGFDITDPEHGGTPLFLAPRPALEEVTVSTAATGAESGGAGALVSLSSIRPGQKWTGSASLGLAPSALQADVSKGSAPALARLTGGHTFSASARGPISGERLRGSFAFEWERADRNERGKPETLRGDRKSLFADLSFAPGPSDEAHLMLVANDLARPFTGRNRFADKTVSEGERAFFGGASWRHVMGGGGALSAQASFAARSIDPPAENGPVIGLERLLNGPVPDAVVDPATLHILRSGVTFAPHAWATGAFRHQLSLAGQGEWSRLTATAASAVVVGELNDGLPARIWSFSALGAAQRSASRLAVLAEDRIRLGERIDARLGARFDSQSGSRPDAASLVSWNDVSPHASLLARPLASVPVFLFGNYARYAGRLPLDLLSYGDPLARSVDILRWTDPNHDGVVQGSEAGVLVARAGPGGSVASIDPNLEAPRTEEVTAGIGIEHGPVRFTFAGVHRSTTRLVETSDVGAPITSYRIRYVGDPGADIVGSEDDQLLAVYDRLPSTFGRDRYVLENPIDHNVVQEGVEFALDWKPGDHWMLRLGGTASKTTGAGANRGFRSSENDPGIPGELYDDPNADSFKTGRMFYDRAYTLKGAVLYRIAGWNAAFVARYQDGQPFARFAIAPGLAQGPELVPAVSRGDHRFTYVLTTDARIAKTFGVGRAQLTASAEAFSLFRQHVEAEEYVVSGPAFRTVVAAPPPLSLWLTLSVRF